MQKNFENLSNLDPCHYDCVTSLTY
jgi:hypothetical protein